MTQTVAADLQQLAKDHLWMHFTRMSGYRDSEIPVIVRGDGCYLEDANGKRYLDALAGLFSVNIGYGFGEEIGQASLEQMRELPFYTNWTYAHPRAIELASEVASLAPGDLNRAFFVSGGSEAVESAWKLARQYYLARGQKRLRTFAGSTTTFPLFVWGAARVSVPPQVNVIASAIFLVSVLFMVGNVLWGLRASRRSREPLPQALPIPEALPQPEAA